MYSIKLLTAKANTFVLSNNTRIWNISGNFRLVPSHGGSGGGENPPMAPIQSGYRLWLPNEEIKLRYRET